MNSAAPYLRCLWPLILTSPVLTFAQTYPGKAVHVVTAEPGGGGDFIARLVSQELATVLGQPFVIENRGAAGGSVAAQTVARAVPDGHTLLFYSGFIWTTPLLRPVSYDAAKDFTPITLVARAPNVLVVHPSLAVKSVKDLIVLAKARPGELSYASSGSGGTPHLAAELFKSMAGVSLLHVAYKGQSQALSDLFGGQVQLMFPNAASAAPHLRSGRVKALAVTTAEPTALAPGLPTVAASGLPGYESVVMFGMWVPAKTPSAIVARINQETLKILGRTDINDRLFKVGVDAAGTSPDQFAALIAAEVARLTKLIRDAGIRAD